MMVPLALCQEHLTPSLYETAMEEVSHVWCVLKMSTSLSWVKTLQTFPRGNSGIVSDLFSFSVSLYLFFSPALTRKLVRLE